MANVTEEVRWENGIYQIETTDPVVGGVDGISNKQAKQLANRTSYLKKQVEDNKSGADLALATKRDVNDSYSKKEVDEKFTDANKLIKEKLDKEGTAADSAKLGGSLADDFMKKSIYKPNNESSANSLVLRDSNGDFAGRYITAGHFRLQAPNQNNIFGGDRELLFRGGSAENDNYIRAVSVPYAASVMGVLGVNQTWKDVTSERHTDVIYTNNTGRTIAIHLYSRATKQGGIASIEGWINDLNVGIIYVGDMPGTTPCITYDLIVPNGATYKLKIVSSDWTGIDATGWYELR